MPLTIEEKRARACLYQKAYRARHPERVRETGRRWREKNRAQRNEYNRARSRQDRVRRRVAERRLLDVYGLSLAEYDALLMKQGGGCALCGRAKDRRRLPVDHDHRTKRVRGILCEACNRGLGLLGDSPARLRRAVAYLEQTESPTEG